MDSITYTIYQLALLSLGHTLERCSDGSWEITANPERAGKFGEVPEADWKSAEEAVREAYRKGERRASVLGVSHLPLAAELPGLEHPPVDRAAVMRDARERYHRDMEEFNAEVERIRRERARRECNRRTDALRRRGQLKFGR